MQRPRRLHPRSVPPVTLAIAVVASAALHGLGYQLATWTTALPDPGIEFHLPSEVELGIADLPAMPPTPEPPPPEPPPPPPPPPPAPAETKPQRPKAKKRRRAPDAAVPDAAVPDATVADAATADASLADAGPQDAGATDAGTVDASGRHTSDAGANKEEGDAGRPLAQTGPDSPRPARTPWQPRSAAGAMISLRLDMALVRNAVIGATVAEVIAALPDVAALLEGSGVDAVRDLDRLLVASPDLSRVRTLVAGRHRGAADLPQQAAARLAAQHARPLTASQVSGVTLLPWYNRDTTARVVALLGNRRFVIARRADVPRITAIDEALSAGNADQARGSGLLSLPAGAAAQVTIDGVQHFARRARSAVPSTAKATVRLRARAPAKGAGPAPVSAAPVVEVQAELTYDGAETARTASEELQGLLKNAAGHPLVRFTGLSSAIRGARLSPEGERVTIQLALSQRQATTVLGMVRDAVQAPPPSGTVGSPAQKPRLPGQ